VYRTISKNVKERQSSSRKNKIEKLTVGGHGLAVGGSNTKNNGNKEVLET
jgi:hypothetical protein